MINIQKIVCLVAVPMMLLACSDKESSFSAGAKEPQLEVSLEPAFFAGSEAGSHVKVQVLEDKLMMFETVVNRGGCELTGHKRTSGRELTVEGQFIFGDYERAFTTCRVANIKEVKVRTDRGDMVYRF